MKVAKSIASQKATLPIPLRDTYIGSPAGWLNDDELGEFIEHIDAIIELLADKPHKTDSKRIVISMRMYPA